MGSFLSLLELAFSLFPSVQKWQKKRRGGVRKNLVENEITSHEGVHWCRISRTFLTACVPLLTLLSLFAN